VVRLGRYHPTIRFGRDGKGWMMRNWFSKRRTPVQELDDLLRRARREHEDSKNLLFEFLRARLLVLARFRVPEAAEDTVHEALLVVHQHLEECDTVDGLLAFSHQVLRNKIGNLYQRRHRWGHDELQEGDAVYWIHDQIEHEELERIILESINRLRETLPVCGEILSSLYCGLEPTEISSNLGISKSNLKTRTFRCRQALRDLLSAQYGLLW
jgi:RNA polymerase sigma factor (sigma-70 family)